MSDAEQKRVGRPPKEEGERLRHSITLRFNDAQWSYLWFWDKPAGQVIRELIDRDLDETQWSRPLDDGTYQDVDMRVEVLSQQPNGADLIRHVERFGSDADLADDDTESYFGKEFGL